MEEIKLRVESEEIKAVTRKLDSDWTCEIEEGFAVKNQNFKLGDTLEDVYGHTYGVVLSRGEKNAYANHAILNKIKGVWRVTCCVCFDLSD